MLAEFQTLINNTNFVITFVSVIINIILGSIAIKKWITYMFSTRLFKKALGFKTKEIVITQSIFEPSMMSGITNNVITYQSVICLNKITTILLKCKYNYKIYEEPNAQFDEINIGGPTCNKKVNIHITTLFPNFKFVTPLSDKSKFDKYPINQQFIEYSQNETGFKIYRKTDKELLHFYKADYQEKDYLFIIKLTPDDFSEDFNKIVFILFGAFDKGTSYIPDFIQRFYKELYKKFKNKHYFIAIPFNNIDNTFDLVTGIIDLTDEMLNST